ncbi:MAG: hypothetical protein QOI59_47 [Gammaproteobacteria bacterium]|nr:hypothetical protein [Gammaproteobacteria bacterium]
MRIRITLVAALVGVIVLTGALVPSPLARAADTEPIVPMGALAHAAKALEQDTNGKILEIRLTDEAGAPAFEAAIAKDDALVYMRIESLSDNVTEIKVRDLPPWLLNYHLEAYMRSIVKAVVPLEQAIVKAEARAHAPAIDAGVAKPLSGTNAVLAYFVETTKGKSRGQFAVDAMTGAFIANPDELYEPHTPVDLARRLAP